MRIFIISVATFLFLILYSLVTATEKRYNLPNHESPIIGNENAPITIVKFIDYQ